MARIIPDDRVRDAVRHRCPEAFERVEAERPGCGTLSAHLTVLAASEVLVPNTTATGPM
jgi:hypothetical protein